MVVALSTTFSFAQDSFDPEFENDTIKRLGEVIISADVLVGSKFKAKNKAGSTYFISSEELKQFNYDDINRILRTVPGVNVVEEEGFGLRPSIGLRGTSPSRSSKITLMEDGVLIAPAPYTAPAAYYFPTVGRMQSFEILKGGSQIQYGPFTTGGAINMVSTQIPSGFNANVLMNMGSFNTRRTYLNVGDNYKNFGYVVEYNNRNSEGFKKIDFSDQTTGFNGNDYVAKFRVNTNADAKIYQSLTVKAQISNEDSDETYLGLTQGDFDANPYRRYLASEADNITTKHTQMMLTHLLIPADNITITTKAYRNDFGRNWYKLQNVVLDGVSYGLGAILDNPDANLDAYNAMTGLNDTPDNALRVRANNRNYRSEGIQTVMNMKFYGENAKHDIDFGVRYHQDSEDRYQWTDGYAIRNQNLIQTNAGVPGTQDNRIGKAEAWAAHALYNFTYNKLMLSPGIRYENILRTNLNYGTADIDRTGENLTTTQNRTDVFIPGMGALYTFSDAYSVFASAHRGFSPPGASEGQKAENSTNIETGFRFNKSKFSGEIIGYYNHFSNLLGADTNAAGGTGMGDLFNAGRAKVKGLEFLATYNVLAEDSKFKLPVTLSYTLTDTELTSNFESGVEAWGTITAGDEIPYIAKHQLGILASLEYDKYSIAVSGKFNDRFRTQAGQGEIPDNQLVKSNFVVDLSARYKLSKQVNIISTVNNLLDNKYAVARVPYGLRPGMPFAANIGISASF